MLPPKASALLQTRTQAAPRHAACAACSAVAPHHRELCHSAGRPQCLAHPPPAAGAAACRRCCHAQAAPPAAWPWRCPAPCCRAAAAPAGGGAAAAPGVLLLLLPPPPASAGSPQSDASGTLPPAPHQGQWQWRACGALGNMALPVCMCECLCARGGEGAGGCSAVVRRSCPALHTEMLRISPPKPLPPAAPRPPAPPAAGLPA